MGYSGVERASSSLIGGLNIWKLDVAEYTDSQDLSCPLVARFNISILLYFDKPAMTFLQVMYCRRKVI